MPQVTKITAKAPETFLPEWIVDQIKQAFPACFHLPRSAAKPLSLTSGRRWCGGSLGEHENPSLFLTQPFATNGLLSSPFSYSFLLLSNIVVWRELMYYQVLAYRLILGTHIAAIIPITKCDQKVGEKSM